MTGLLKFSLTFSIKSMFRIILVLLCSVFLFSSCLKTRNQLKGEGATAAETQGESAPATVKEVKPQGQYVLDEIKSEMTHLSGRVEDLERNQKQEGGTTSKEEIKKLETRIVELEHAQAAMIETLKKLSSIVPVPDRVEIYEKGRALFQAKDYKGAVEALSEYLGAIKPKRAEDAMFLRGEAFYQLKDHKKAIIDFSKFPEKFQHSSKLPLALYKIGLSFEALGMKEDAKGFYQELVDKFPKSGEAKKAKAKIQ